MREMEIQRENWREAVLSARLRTWTSTSPIHHSAGSTVKLLRACPGSSRWCFFFVERFTLFCQRAEKASLLVESAMSEKG
jgi:hypothetical protein